MSTDRVYFDYNASADVCDAVMQNISKILFSPHNPSSIHQLGQEARIILEDTRESILKYLGISNKDYRIIFTSGATEAANLCLRGLDLKHIYFSSVEHSAIRETAKFLKHSSELPVSIVDGQMKLSLEGLSGSSVYAGSQRRGAVGEASEFSSKQGRVEDSWTQPNLEKTLLAYMAVNNETGHITDFESAFAAAKEINQNTVTLCDASQLIGKTIVPSFKNTDCIIFSSHKFGALQGGGALIIKKDLKLVPEITGGSQELRYRAGTENIPAIWSIGVALNQLNLEERLADMAESQKIICDVLSKSPNIKINFQGDNCVKNTISITVNGISGSDLVVGLDLKGVCISSGSACSSGKTDPSHVLSALGMSREDAGSTVRISVGPNLNKQSVKSGAERILEFIERL